MTVVRPAAIRARCSRSSAAGVRRSIATARRFVVRGDRGDDGTAVGTVVEALR
jgi:hypothetical protein